MVQRDGPICRENVAREGEGVDPARDEERISGEVTIVRTFGSGSSLENAVGVLQLCLSTRRQCHRHP
jgi:hypothetical protein